ncbi:MAG: hypothetical protein ABIE23_02815 [archaeon]
MKKIDLIFFISIMIFLFLVGCIQTPPLICEDGIHAPGESWSVRCNTCGCGRDGIIICTQAYCPTFCADGIHSVGERWLAEDGCNTCTCTKTGIACTEMYCVPEGDFEVHEWGVMAGCSESDGFFVTSRPKQLLLVRQPVVYIHSGEGIESFDASFEFNEGNPTDTYPEAVVEGKKVEWNNVRIVDSCGEPAVRSVKGFVPLEEIIDELNDVDADCLEVGDEKNRFLFYEGEMGFENPIEAEEILDENKVKVKNNADYSVFNLFFVSGKGDFMNPIHLSGRVEELKAGEEKTIELNEEDKSNFIREDLLELGFTEKETNAFTSLWDYSFFNPTNTGFEQVVYRLPQEKYDELIESFYNPKPKKEVRALYVLFDLS